MGRSRYHVINEAPHFLTCTILEWLPVFTDSRIVDMVLDSLRYLQSQQRLFLYGYVILENHLHLIASSPNLSKEIGIFKSFTARKIIDYLEEQQRWSLLEQLRFHKTAHKTDRTYQLWQEGSHPTLILNEEMMREKLEYLHNNPVRRGYVDEPVCWRYSSSRNYAGKPPLLELNGLQREETRNVKSSIPT